MQRPRMSSTAPAYLRQTGTDRQAGARGLEPVVAGGCIVELRIGGDVWLQRHATAVLGRSAVPQTVRARDVSSADAALPQRFDVRAEHGVGDHVALDDIIAGRGAGGPAADRGPRDD